jgi:Tfp pilus assembly protein PilX
MKGTARDTIGNEKGFVLVVALLMVAVITVIGIAATRTSETEIRISVNERDSIKDFYTAERALIDMLESSTNWLKGNMVTSPAAGAFTACSVTEDKDYNIDFNNDGTDDTPIDAMVEIRCIAATTAPVAGLTEGANDVPAQPHTGPPPAGSGYSMKHFEIHRYGVTATATDPITQAPTAQVQTGVWKVFNIQ